MPTKLSNARHTTLRTSKMVASTTARLRAHIQLPQRNQPGHADYHLHSPVSALGHIKHIHKDALCQRSDIDIEDAIRQGASIPQQGGMQCVLTRISEILNNLIGAGCFQQAP